MNYPSRRNCLAGGLGIGLGRARLASADEKPLGPADLKGDADIFQDAYSTLHPGLFRYNTPSEIYARFADLKRAMVMPRSLGDAYLAFSRVTAAVRCGHSFLNPYNQQGAPMALIGDRAIGLPFRFVWLGGRMIVMDDSHASPALQRGSEIVEIGGVSARDILSELLPHVSIDGHNEAKRRRLLELRGEDNWEMFDVLFALRFPNLVRSGRTQLMVSPPDGGAARRLEVELVPHVLRAAGLKAGIETKGRAEPAWRLELMDEGVAWLTMRSWALYDSKWDWEAALNADLDDLAGDPARTLIVDLRGNGGGLDVGDLILSRLVEHDRPKSGMVRKVRYRRVPDRLLPHLKTWDTSFRDWGDQAAGPDSQGFYQLTRADDDPAGELIKAQGKRFTGKLIVLVDAANSSATFQFAQSVKLNGLGKLVGQTTGGNRRGINGGAFFFLRLPRSELEIDLPLIGTFPKTPQPDAGIEPDVLVALTREDIIAGRDPFVDAARRLASARSRAV